ncbi:MAG: ammonium transporter [Deltaproteobacteria bacterium]|nr:ammonium transporter [Deltaproteobacteria bacterium]
MNKTKSHLRLFLTLASIFLFVSIGNATELGHVVEVQKYNRAIHIMAMLLAGFGFLMVFVKKYGRSAVTATYLLVSVALPLYILKDSLGILGGSGSEIDSLILAEFAAASLLICAGAPLGRLKMGQYILLGLLFVPCYAFNEWIILDHGFGLIAHGSFVDMGGSVVIHAFGAIFGLGVIMTMTTPKEIDIPIEADDTSDRFSLLGSMILWLFWPSFCSALVAPELIPHTAINVILALCGATIATYFASIYLRGKIDAADIANAALAGGVAIGSTCDLASWPQAFAIGIIAGGLSTFGFAVLQGKVEKLIKGIDTCGVMNLHGLPGLFGGLAAIFIVDGINKGNQLAGIGITILVAIITGFVTGKIIALLGRRTAPYDDAEEFEL